MKKTYIAPVSQSIDFQCDGTLLSLSLTEKSGGGTLGNGDVESGDYEICSNKKEYWETEW